MAQLRDFSVKNTFESVLINLQLTLMCDNLAQLQSTTSLSGNKDTKKNLFLPWVHKCFLKGKRLICVQERILSHQIMDDRGEGNMDTTWCPWVGVFMDLLEPRNWKKRFPIGNLEYRYPIGNWNRYTRTTHMFFSPRHYDHILPHARWVFASSLSTGPPRDHGALHCHWTAIATKPIGQRVPVQTRCILHGPEEQSWPRGGKSIGVTDQPQYPIFLFLQERIKDIIIIQGSVVSHPPCTLLLALPFFFPSSFHTISLSPAFISARWAD